MKGIGYLIMPLGDGRETDAVIKQNMENAKLVMRTLMILGVPLFVPHLLHGQFEGKKLWNRETALDYCKLMTTQCGYGIVGHVGGVPESFTQGMVMEMNSFKDQGKPIIALYFADRPESLHPTT